MHDLRHARKHSTVFQLCSLQQNSRIQTEFSGPPWETARLPSEAVCIIRAPPTCAWRLVLTCLDMSAAWEKAHLPPVSVTSEDAAQQRDAWALNFFKVKWFISSPWWKACGLKSSSRSEIKTCFALRQKVMHARSGSGRSSNRNLRRVLLLRALQKYVSKERALGGFE